MEDAAMQMNEIVGQVQKSTRRPDMSRAFKGARTKLEPRSERQDADASRRRNALADTTHIPPRYGAGF